MAPGWAYVALFLCLLVLVSRFATTFLGALALVLSLLLAYWRLELALVLLFSSAFLPYVWGLPFTAGYAVIACLAALAFWELRFHWYKLPFMAVSLCAMLLITIFITYPFSLSIDCLVLLAGLVGMLEAMIFAKGVPHHMRVEKGFFGALVIVVFLPLAVNSLLGPFSPFWLLRHRYLFEVDRYTVGVLDPNVLAAYASACWVVYLFCVRLQRGRLFRNFGIITLGVFLIYVLDSTGSRSALVVAGCALIFSGVVSLVASCSRLEGYGICGRSMSFLATFFCFLVLAVVVVNIAMDGKVFPGVTRLRETPGWEETGRPKSFREAAPYLDKFPLVGYDMQAYVRDVSSHTPHMNLAASVLFLGVPVALLLYVLLMFPVANLFFRLAFVPSLGLSLAITVFLLTTLALPVTSERGLMTLLGAWFGYSRLPGWRVFLSGSKKFAMEEGRQ